MNDLTKKDFAYNDWSEEDFSPWLVCVSIVIVFAVVGTIEFWSL